VNYPPKNPYLKTQIFEEDVFLPVERKRRGKIKTNMTFLNNRQKETKVLFQITILHSRKRKVKKLRILDTLTLDNFYNLENNNCSKNGDQKPDCHVKRTIKRSIFKEKRAISPTTTIAPY
jgi:hypothetical protein